MTTPRHCTNYKKYTCEMSSSPTDLSLSLTPPPRARHLSPASLRPVFLLVCVLKTSLAAFQGTFNSLVYGSTDAVKSAVAQELLVERCLKASGAGRSGGGGAGAVGLGVGGAGDLELLDPEDEQDGSSGVGMANIRWS